MTQPIVAIEATSTLYEADRIRAIARIHAFADWLAAHPEVPAPTDLKVYSHTESAAEVHDLADRKDIAVHAPDDPASTTRWCTIRVAELSDSSMRIDYVRIGH